MRCTCFERAKFIAGVGLVVAGAFILFEHLDRAAVLWGNVFRTLGIVPAVIFAASRLARASAGERRFLQDFVEQVVIASWPLVLVMAGAVLSRDGRADEGASLLKKDGEGVDPAGGRSTLK